MSLHFVCPACSTPVTVGGAVPDACPKCGAPLPAPLRQSLALGRSREQFPLPMFLQIGRVVTPFMGIGFLAFLVLAPFDIGTYSIGADQVSGPEFLRQAGVAFGVIGVCLSAIAFALWSEAWWGRWAMMGYWVITGAVMLKLPDPDGTQMFGAVMTLLFGGGIAGWYLFGKENVVGYYKELERREDASAKVEK